jgi:hypothetical protein
MQMRTPSPSLYATADSRCGSILFRPVFEAGARHVFAQTALFDKIPFQTPQLLVKKVIGYLNKSDDGIGANCRIVVLSCFAERCIIRVRRAAERLQSSDITVVFRPFGKSTCFRNAWASA